MIFNDLTTQKKLQKWLNDKTTHYRNDFGHLITMSQRNVFDDQACRYARVLVNMFTSVSQITVNTDSMIINW